VVIAGYQSQSFKLAYHPTLLPVDSTESKVLAPTEEFRWQPENALEVAISIVMSETDQHLLVYRNGIEIGRAKISMTLPDKNLGTHTLCKKEQEQIVTLF